MQSQAISELQFSKFYGGACPQTPPAGRNFFFRFNKTLSNFGLDPRLLVIEKFFDSRSQNYIGKLKMITWN